MTEVDLEAGGEIDLAWMLDFLGRRCLSRVEHFDGSRYRRTVRLERGAGIVSVEPSGAGIATSVAVEHEADRPEAVARLRALLDLDVDGVALAAYLAEDRFLGPVWRSRPGLRVPGTAEPNELAVRAVIGQQVSVAGARTLASTLVEACGDPVDLGDDSLTHLFPRPEVLADSSLGEVGMPRARKDAIRSLCAALADGTIALDGSMERAETRERLLALRGIGPWTADYVVMRTLGDPDVFLASDLGVRKAMERLGLPSKPGEAMRAAERWRPWRSYAVQYLWWSLG